MNARTTTVLGAAVAALGTLLGAPRPITSQTGSTSVAGAVRGVVVEAESGRALGGATLVLAEFAGESRSAAHRVTETDEAGEYRFEDVPAGRYRVEVSRLGYRSAELIVELPHEWTIRRSVGLAVEPLVLEPIAIELVAQPAAFAVRSRDGRSQGAAAVLSPMAPYRDRPNLAARSLDPLELGGASPLGEPDVLRALQRLPGVSAQGDYAASVWTRGAPWGLTHITLDGLPLRDPLHLGGVATGLTAQGLGSVNYLPGVRSPSASIGVAGSVELHTRTAVGGPHGSFALTPMATRLQVEDRVWDGRLGASVSLRRTWWDVVDPPSALTGEDGKGRIDYRFTDVSGRVDARLGEHVLLEAGGLHEIDRVDGEIYDFVAASTGEWGNRLAWMSATTWAGPLSVKAMAGRSRYRARTRPMPWAAYRTDGVPTLGTRETSLEHSVARVEIGGTALRGRAAWTAGAERVGERLEQDDPDARVRGLPGIDGPARLARTSGWFELRGSVGPLAAAGGWVAHATDAEGADPAIHPSLTVRWFARPWLTIEGAVGSSVQFVHPVAAAGQAFGPGLGIGHLWTLAGEGREPLRAREASLGGEASLGAGMSLQLVGWRRTTRGFPLDGVLTLADGLVRPASYPDSSGVERGSGVEVTVRRSDRRVTGEISYSRGSSAFRGGLGEAWPSPASRRHSLNALLSGRVRRSWRVGATLTAESGWPIVVGPSQPCMVESIRCVPEPPGHVQPDHFAFSTSPAFASVDLFVDWEGRGAGLDWGLTASVRNALGRDNAAAFRAGTCLGREVITPVCDRFEGRARYSPGLTRPSPAVALRIRF